MYGSLLPVRNMSFPAISLSSTGFYDGHLDGEQNQSGPFIHKRKEGFGGET
ncbi:hypothetical protein DPMN_105881 [Dreissena polymorpha]|uniref:Uncharacterized protein n=1 Tax=Dreissena polymorpha TaxID=45954 RepID=A0A9D4QI65_DREPO|nr:hypothetical protein DPMN_105881 [Dreissena polymorpha]